MADAYTDIRSFVNQRLQGKFWTALLTAIAAGDNTNAANIIAVKENIFITTASGNFLDKLTARIGITRPSNVGMDDADYSALAIKETSTKLVTNVFLDVLQIFYGAAAVCANVTSGLTEDYVLSDGMQLAIGVDSNPVPLVVTFTSAQFADISSATAEEVCNAISNASFAQGFSLTASTTADQVSGLNFVTIISGTKGPRSAITILGGQAQNILKFPSESLAIPRYTTQFTTSFSGPYVRYTWTGGTDPSLNFLNPGDYVNIYGSGYLATNLGYFIVQSAQGGSVGQAYFEILNPNYQVNGQTNPVTLNPVNSNSGNGLTSRSVDIALAPNGAIRSGGLVTITTTVPHQLSTGQIITIQNVYDSEFDGTYEITFASSTSFTYVQGGPDAMSGQGQVLQNAVIEPVFNGAVRFDGVSTITTTTPHGYTVGQSLTIDGVQDSSFDGLFSIATIPTSTTFTYSQTYTNDIVFYVSNRVITQQLPRYASVYEVNPGEVVIFMPITTNIVRRSLIGSWHLHGSTEDTSFLGSYIFDRSLPAITKTYTNLQTQIDQGQIYTVINAANTSDFPNSTGYLYFEFGTKRQEGPVKYLETPSTGTLLIDPSYKFKQNHAPGTNINLLYSRAAYVPATDGSDYQAYLTDTTAGSTEAIRIIESLAASGFFINIVLVYPQDPGLNHLKDWVYGSGDTYP
jgi:hypothetical protein